MGDISSMVGIISGLISIYSFITGTTTLRLLKQKPAHIKKSADERSITTEQRSKRRMLVWVTAPIFLVSLMVTLSMGIVGSDIGGIMFLLLIISGLSAILYVRRFAGRLSWAAYLFINVALLGGLGFIFGSISTGEEVEALQMGLVSGIGVGLISYLLTRKTGSSQITVSPRGLTLIKSVNAPSTQHERSDVSPQSEKEILQLARKQNGEIRVTDVALHTEVSLDQARDILNSLADRHYCEKQTDERGSILYSFPDFLHE